MNTRPSRIALAMLAGAIAALGGCTGPDATTPLNAPVMSDRGTFTVTVRVADGALHRGVNDFAVSVRNSDASPAVLTHVTGIMPAHGHTANAPDLVANGAGEFGVSDLQILMPGEWEIRLTLSHDGSTDDDVATILTEVE